MKTDSRGRARIGVVVPVSNSNLEPDMTMLRPAGVSLHYTRAGGYDLEAVPDSDQMRGFALASLEGVLEALVAVRPDVLLYGCTSATLSHGPAFDREFQEKMERRAGVPAATAAGALVEALEYLGCRRVSFASPYTKALNEDGAAFLEESGVEVVARADVGEDLGNYGQGALTPSDVLALGRRADDPRADALVLSCTDMRALEALPELERELGKPVVSSNLALMFAAARRLDIAPDELPYEALLYGPGAEAA